MPYQREGSLKVTDHWVRSPLLNINHACQTCHYWSEEELKARAETLQERVFGLRSRAMDALMALIGDLKAARAGVATDAHLDPARRHQRRAQVLLGFVEAENSVGFHAPGKRDGCSRSRSTTRGRARSTCCAPARPPPRCRRRRPASCAGRSRRYGPMRHRPTARRPGRRRVRAEAARPARYLVRCRSRPTTSRVSNAHAPAGDVSAAAWRWVRNRTAVGPRAGGRCS